MEEKREECLFLLLLFRSGPVFYINDELNT
jgi:hypothetical protein